MLHKMRMPSWRKKVIDELHGHVERIGWAATAVFDADPPFAYTSGLEISQAHPDLLIVGLPPQLAHAVLSDAYDLIKSGTALEPGQDYDKIILNFKVRIRKCEGTALEALALTEDMYGHQPQAVQLLWPDEGGHYPGEPEYLGPSQEVSEV